MNNESIIQSVLKQSKINDFEYVRIKTDTGKILEFKKKETGQAIPDPYKDHPGFKKYLIQVGYPEIKSWKVLEVHHTIAHPKMPAHEVAQKATDMFWGDQSWTVVKNFIANSGFSNGFEIAEQAVAKIVNENASFNSVRDFIAKGLK